jgi:hypothetical protein
MRVRCWAAPLVCTLLWLALRTWLRHGQQDLRVYVSTNGSHAAYVPVNVPVQSGGVKVLESEAAYPPPYPGHMQTHRLRPAVGPVQQAKTVDPDQVETFAFVSCLVWLLLLAGQKFGQKKVSAAHVSQLRTNGELSCVATRGKEQRTEAKERKLSKKRRIVYKVVRTR